jgi:hypothetical protein
MSDRKRVVLVMPKPDPKNLSDGDSRRLQSTLDQLAALGWIPVAVIDPSRHLDALRMVLGGMADLVVVTRPEDFPLVRLSSDLDASRAGRRTMRLPRPDRTDTDPRQRRPQPLEHGQPAAVPQQRTQLVDRTQPVEERRTRTARPVRDVGTGEPLTDSAPPIAQAAARFGTPVPNPAGRRRASNRHRRTVAGRRRSA